MEDKMPNDHHQDIRSLFQAAARNDVETLNSLIQENPHLVSDISSHTDRTTPLHVSASRGHLAFTTSLLKHDPRLATERDFLRRTPLHVASAKGHVEVVKALLGLDPCDRCRAPDNGGQIPLHWAVIRGKDAVVTELVAACPESLAVSLEGDTVLHLAVKYNQLKTLKKLVCLFEDNDYYSGILTEGNREGNTVLHLAVLLDQTEMVKYLLKLPKIKSEATETLNKEGLNALEALENKSTPQYLKPKPLRKALRKGGVRSRPKVPAKTWLGKIFCFINTLFTVNWMTEARSQLVVVSTIITTITFQVAVNPPGGVFQVSYTDMQNPTTLNMLHETQRCQNNFIFNLNHAEYHKECQLPGNAVSGYFHPIVFGILTVFNTGAFLSSLCVTIILASGFPLRNPIVLYFFNLCVAFTLESLMITFLLSVYLSSPMFLLTEPGNIVAWETVLTFLVFGVFLTLNLFVLTWGLLKILLHVVKYMFVLTWGLLKKLRDIVEYILCLCSRKRNGAPTTSPNSGRP